MLNSYEEATADFQLQKQGLELLDKYAHIIKEQFHAVLPMD